MLDWLYDLFPITIPSSFVCNYEIGDLFEENSGVYLLLSRDAINARVVQWTKWTKLFWRNKLGNRSKTTN